MVVSRKSAELLPAPGDVVELILGFARVRGTVVESYASGAHPQVVVELPSESAGEDAATVTVPPEAVQPTESAHSPWADHQRYEGTVIEALNRVLTGFPAELKVHPRDVQPPVDVLIIGPQKVVAVEMKHSAKSDGSVGSRAAMRQLQRIAHRHGYEALFVTDARSSKRSASMGDVHTVQWRDHHDDAALREELANIYGKKIGRARVAQTRRVDYSSET